MKSLDSYPALPIVNIPVGSHHIRSLLGGVFRQGIDAEDILATANIAVSALDSDAALSGEQLQRLILCIRETLNDDYLGFLKVPAKLAMDFEAGRAALRGSHLGEALRNLTGFINAVRSDEERALLLDGSSGQAFLRVRFSGFVDGADPHTLYSYRMYWGYRFYCWLIGQRIKLTRVEFSGPRPDDSIDYEQVFACQVLFEQQADRLAFQKNWLRAPIIRSEVELLRRSFPLEYPNWFSIPGRDQTLSSEVVQLITKLHSEGSHNPSLDKIANLLSMSGRSLSRKLAAEQESFQRLKTRVRCDLAKDMLAHGDTLITTVAEKLGFSEPGAFTRAFIGWTGKTPSVYRSQHGAAGLASQAFRITDQYSSRVPRRYLYHGTRDFTTAQELQRSCTANAQPRT